MRKFNKHLYDNINREYDRKNLYLYEVSVLQEKIEAATGKEKQDLENKLNQLVKNKKDHPYNKQLAEYKNKEKAFLSEVNKNISNYKSKVDKNLSPKVQKLEIRLFKAKELVKFYKNYTKLTYDAELIYEQSKIEIAQIPPVIEFAKSASSELVKAQDKLTKINQKENEKFEVEFKSFKEEENKKLQDRIKEVKSKCKEGLISRQAKDNTIKELKRRYKEAILVKSFENEKIYNEEIIKNKKYELSKAIKQKINTVNINVADLRRVYPVESEKTLPWVSWVTFLIPGLAQCINKQYVKAIIMFFATIYIYAVAIPYALGYGNYKGEGIAGLVSLAAGKGRLDRSIIFMIEGILAIFLVLIGIFLIYLCFKDANKVEKDTIIMWVKILIACVPAAIVGVLFDDKLNELFYNPTTVAIMLILFGILFIIIENYNKGKSPKINSLSKITYTVAIMIGIFQLIAAVFPGTSRSGATIVGALLIGVSRTIAAEFTFFLAIPVMLGASALKLVKFALKTGFVMTGNEVAILSVGTFVAFIVSILAIKFLMSYIKSNDFKVFGWYRIILGILVLAYFYIIK